MKRTKWDFPRLTQSDFNGIEVISNNGEPSFFVKGERMNELEILGSGTFGKVVSFGNTSGPLFVVKFFKGVQEKESEPLKVLRRAGLRNECNVVPLRTLSLGRKKFSVMPVMLPIEWNDMSLENAFQVYKSIRDQIRCLAHKKMYYYDLKPNNTMLGPNSKAYLVDLGSIQGPGLGNEQWVPPYTFTPLYLINSIVIGKNRSSYWTGRSKEIEHKYNLAALGIIYFLTLLNVERLSRPYKYWGSWEENRVPDHVQLEFKRINLKNGEYPVYYTLYTYLGSGIRRFPNAYERDLRSLLPKQHFIKLINAAAGDNESIRSQLIADIIKYECPYKPIENPKMRFIPFKIINDILLKDPLYNAKRVPLYSGGIDPSMSHVEPTLMSSYDSYGSTEPTMMSSYDSYGSTSPLESAKMVAMVLLFGGLLTAAVKMGFSSKKKRRRPSKRKSKKKRRSKR